MSSVVQTHRLSCSNAAVCTATAGVASAMIALLHYCDWSPAGAIKQYTGHLVAALDPDGYDLTLVLRQDPREFDGRRHDEADLQDELRRACGSLITLPGGYLSWRAAKLMIEAFYRQRRYAEFDVFHLQLTHDPWFLWLAWRLPTVLTVHEPAPRTGHPRLRGLRGVVDRSLRYLYRQFADVIVVHTESGRRGLSARESRKSIVIPHGVTARSTATSPDPDAILFFGRVAEYKGLDVLLSAMDEVWKVRPDARLRILANPGDGIGDHDRDYDPRITATWDGYSVKDLESALAEARVVCLPYLSASGSGVAAEAIGACRTIVASDLEDLGDVASHPDLRVEPGSSHDLARALISALSHDYPPRSVDPQWTWPEVARTHARIYEDLLLHRPRSRRARGQIRRWRTFRPKH